MPATFNIDIERGGTFKHRITAIDTTSNTNILVGATSANAVLRETSTSKDIEASFVCTFGANNAYLTVEMYANTTGSLTISSGVWDLQLTYPDKVVYPLAGRVSVHQRVTR